MDSQTQNIRRDLTRLNSASPWSHLTLDQYEVRVEAANSNGRWVSHRKLNTAVACD